MAPGVLLALSTSVCWAFGNVFIQKSSRLVGEARALLWALLLGGLLAGAAGLVLDTRPLPIDGTAVFCLLVAGVFGLLAYALMFYAFARAKLTIAVPFISSWSLVAGAISLTVMGERVAPIRLVGALLVVVGVVLVSASAVRDPSRPSPRPSPRRSGEREAEGVGGGGQREAEGVGGGGQREAEGVVPGGVGAGGGKGPGGLLGVGVYAALPGAAGAGARRPLLAAFGSGVAFGVMVPALDRAGLSFGSFGGAGLVYFIGLALAVPLALGFRVDLRLPPRPAWGVILGTGVTESLGFVCLAAAGRFAPVALVAPLASLAATLTVLYAWIVLRERPPRLTLLGAMIASSGVVVVSM